MSEYSDRYSAVKHIVVLLGSEAEKSSEFISRDYVCVDVQALEVMAYGGKRPRGEAGRGLVDEGAMAQVLICRLIRVFQNIVLCDRSPDPMNYSYYRDEIPLWVSRLVDPSTYLIEIRKANEKGD